MSYTITLTNGKTLAVLADQSFDSVSSSLTLIGKNVNAYGQYVNNNFVGLLENFASITSPRSPVQGQIWFDTSEGRIKVYNLDQFKPVGSPIIATAEPGEAVNGDFWFNPTTKELQFTDGTSWYSTAEQTNVGEAGKAGWFVEVIQDLANDDQVVAKLYSNDTEIAAVTSRDIPLINNGTEFQTYGTSTLRAGMTLNPSFKIYGTATNSLNWNNLSTSSFFIKDVFNETSALISIADNAGLYIGTASDIQILVEDNGTSITGVFYMAGPNDNYELRYNNGYIGTATAMYLDGTNNHLGIFTNNPQDVVDINGSTTIRGNLTVIGTSTNIDVTQLSVQDKNIVLANGNTLDIVADGGGITLAGATDKTFNWYSSTTSWTSSENLNLDTGKTYKIGGVDVLTANLLGTGTQHAPGLVDLPVLNHFTVTNLSIANSGPGQSGGIFKAPYIDPLTTQVYWSDLYIVNTGTGNINLGNYTSIIGSAPTTATSVPSTLITKGYFDSFLGDISTSTAIRKTFTVTIDITPVSNSSENNINAYIIGYLNRLLPVDGQIGGADPFGDATYYKLPINTRCSVLAQFYTGTTQPFVLSLDKSYVTVDKGGNPDSQSVLQDVAASASPTQATTIYTPIVSHLVKTFYVLDNGLNQNIGTWTFVTNIL